MFVSHHLSRMLYDANISRLNQIIYYYRRQENHVKGMLQENIQWQNRFQDRLRKEDLSSKQKTKIQDTLFNLQKLYKLLQHEQEIFYHQLVESSTQIYGKTISYDSLEKQQHYNKQVRNLIQQQLHVMSDLLSGSFSPSEKKNPVACITSVVEISLEILNECVIRNIEEQQKQIAHLEENQSGTKVREMTEAKLKRLKKQQNIHAHLEQNLQRQQFIKSQLGNKFLGQEEYKKFENELNILCKNRKQLFKFHELFQDEFNKLRTRSCIETQNMSSDLLSNLALQQTQNLFYYINQQQTLENVLEQNLTQNNNNNNNDM